MSKSPTKAPSRKAHSATSIVGACALGAQPLKLKKHVASLSLCLKNRPASAAGVAAAKVAKPKILATLITERMARAASNGEAGIAPANTVVTSLRLVELARPMTSVVSSPKELNALMQPEQPVVTAPAKTVPAVVANRRARREAARRHIDLDQPGFIKLEDVLTLIPVSRAAWYAGVKDGIYPAPVPLGKRSVAYRNQDIKALITRLSCSSAAPGDKQVNVGVVSATT